MNINIIYIDDYLAVVEKPESLIVHRSVISSDRDSLVQRLQNQLSCKIYPINRLDRGTSGLILFASSKESASVLGKMMMNRELTKKYIAIVRGWIFENGVIDYELDGKNCISKFKPLKNFEFNVPCGRYNTSRYSLVEIELLTGRRHQIRRHFAHIRHPILGDSEHGDGAHNKSLRKNFGINRLMLHSAELKFIHPYLACEINLISKTDKNFHRLIHFNEGVME